MKIIGRKENTIPAFMMTSLQTRNLKGETTIPILREHYEVKKRKQLQSACFLASFLKISHGKTLIEEGNY